MLSDSAETALGLVGSGSAARHAFFSNSSSSAPLTLSFLNSSMFSCILNVRFFQSVYMIILKSSKPAVLGEGGFCAGFRKILRSFPVRNSVSSLCRSEVKGNAGLNKFR